MFVSFIGALLGALVAYGALYGVFLVLAWRKRRRVDARVAKLLSDFLARTAERDDKVATSAVTKNPNAN